MNGLEENSIIDFFQLNDWNKRITSVDSVLASRTERLKLSKIPFIIPVNPFLYNGMYHINIHKYKDLFLREVNSVTMG